MKGMGASIVVAAVVGLATAASALSLRVYTTDAAGVETQTFSTGETILLKVTGDAQGGYAGEDSIFAQLFWDGALTTTVGAAQGNWLPVHGELFPEDGYAYAFNQVSPSGRKLRSIRSTRR